MHSGALAEPPADLTDAELPGTGITTMPGGETVTGPGNGLFSSLERQRTMTVVTQQSEHRCTT
ncbi:hypothetical protein [Microbispora bryophytorum]|uniref:Uncharacterized protein n=1 Tax=Microbispora bryophytorum TaxID=1460882 RepID=A0A8H9GZE0_9ACTN|nr:hypothetical protein [Microbispora bryophytorum]MBD3134681.1 hypothetical protein [Microbispora bryophytorum]TQS09038.1 hypothetical protein FLX07_07430 [Microbispora bryophytorum]GGO12829.1 hypothetical protein GCM10011574_31720 [Microbispora bryophytorum]